MHDRHIVLAVAPFQEQHAAVIERGERRVPPSVGHHRTRGPRVLDRVVDDRLVQAGAVGEMAAGDQQAAVGEEAVAGAEQVRLGGVVGQGRLRRGGGPAVGGVPQERRALRRRRGRCAGLQPFGRVDVE